MCTGKNLLKEKQQTLFHVQFAFLSVICV